MTADINIAARIILMNPLYLGDRPCNSENEQGYIVSILIVLQVYPLYLEALENSLERYFVLVVQ